VPEETTYPFTGLFATLHELGRDSWSGLGMISLCKMLPRSQPFLWERGMTEHPKS
jgi:hypothetical protein